MIMEYTEVFEKALCETLGREGGYVNDIEDAGGETIYGISRRYHPKWGGWMIVDSYKGTLGDLSDLDGLINDDQFKKTVTGFYQFNFWDRFQGDLVTKVSHDVALEMFDTSVNMGVSRGVIFLQRSLNYLNRNQESYDDLVEDSLMGPASLDCLRRVKIINDIPVLLKIMNVLQGMHYLEYMSKSPKQEKFARGWFSRVSI